MKRGNQYRHNLVAANRELIVFIETFGGGGRRQQQTGVRQKAEGFLYRSSI